MVTLFSDSDLLFLSSLNETLSKLHRRRGGKAGPPAVNFSKLDLDMGLNGQKCETEVPVRDTIIVSNSGGSPIDLRLDGVRRDDATLK